MFHIYSKNKEHTKNVDGVDDYVGVGQAEKF